MAVVLSCPSCRAPLALTTAPPPGAVVRCPQCKSTVPPAPGDNTHHPSAVNATRTYQPPQLETVVRKGPPPVREEPPTAPGFLAPPERPDEIGRLGPYRVLGRLGAGGMGVVFHAEDPLLQRAIALKVMLPEFTSNPTWKARFVREAHAQAKVEHDHVAAIYDVGEHDGVAYITMPLLKGQALGAALKQNRQPPLKEVLRIGREVALGLAAAHEQGLVHRDIKPGNIWLEGNRRRVKILDFGLARTSGSADAAPDTVEESSRGAPIDGTLTVQGAVVGTPAYMSPEQGRGEKVDHRTDLYSLGVMLYQMTTGKLPYTGSTALAILIAIETERPDPPNAVNPIVPPPLADFVMRLLAKAASDRPQSAEAVAEELQQLEEALGTSVNLIGPPPVPVPNDPWSDLDSGESTAVESAVVRPNRTAEAAPVKRWPLVAAGCAVALLAVLGAFVLKPKSVPPTESSNPEPVALKPPAPTKPIAPKEKEPAPKEKEPPAVPARELLPLPELAALEPTIRIDYSKGPPAKGPVARKDPNGQYEWRAGANALRFATTGGTWWAHAGDLPESGAAVELRARVVSDNGAVVLNPWAYPSVVTEGTAGALVTVDHLGALTLLQYKAGKTPDEFPTRTFRHKAIKPRGEWNTILVVLRDDHVNVYVNGEEVVAGVALWKAPAKQVRFGVRSTTGPAEVEHERITIWDLSALPKK